MAVMKSPLRIAPQAWKFAAPLIIIAAILIYLGANLAGGSVLLLSAAILGFFRDPERATPKIPNSICAPADGRITAVEEIDCQDMPDGRAQRISIFLSLFDVHIQRAPVSGMVSAVERRSGRYGSAVRERSAAENQSNTVWINSDFGLIGVRQIVGMIARRIVCNAKEGDYLERGERYGLIQFGSRVDLLLPLDASVKAAPGQRVRAGETCLALFFEEEIRKGIVRESRSSAENVQAITAKAG